MSPVLMNTFLKMQLQMRSAGARCRLPQDASINDFGQIIHLKILLSMQETFFGFKTFLDDNFSIIQLTQN